MPKCAIGASSYEAATLLSCSVTRDATRCVCTIPCWHSKPRNSLHPHCKTACCVCTLEPYAIPEHPIA